MTKSVYLVSGPNLPTKIAVVAFELEHETLLDIENRFLRGAKYTTLTRVHRGAVKLASPTMGKYDQVMLMGDSCKLDFEGDPTADVRTYEPGKVTPMDEAAEYTARRAFLVEHTKAGVTEEFVIVHDAELEAFSAEGIARALTHIREPSEVNVQYISSGTMLVDEAVALPGFTVRVEDSVSY